MLTAMHMLDSTYTSPSSPWLPPDRHLTASPPPPPAPAATTATLHHLRAATAAGRRIAKRRQRPSRRLPTTYITADPANFRRMVHQVTGADDLPPPPLALSTPQPELLRQVSAPAGSAVAGALMLPTLDTSAYLLGRGGPGSRSEAAAAPACDSSPALVGGAAYGSNNSSCCSSSNCGFPTLDSWDLL